MKERIIMAGLLVGAAGGFASGFAGLHHKRHAARSMARECVDAALREVGHDTADSQEAQRSRIPRHVRHRVRQACADEARRQAKSGHHV